MLLERNVAAHSIRANALDMAFKIRGPYLREQEFSAIVIDAAHRPDWEAMRRARPKIDVPGLNIPPKGE
jgi:hypothetical protein